MRMKTAVSIPDKIFDAADRAAKRLGVSRSSFYASALNAHLERLRSTDVTRRLDDVYARQDSSIDPVLERMQGLSLENEDW